MRSPADHALHVDAWLEQAGKDASPEVLVGLFEAALGAMWARTETTLGATTLTVIADRVLCNASEKFPFLSTLTVKSVGGIQCREFRERLSSVHRAELREAIRFVLAEFLTVLGSFSAELLTPELHAELSRVALPTSVGSEKGAQCIPADTAGEDERS